MNLRLLNHAEQVAAYLRSEILRGRWAGELPGADRLGKELGINHTTIGAGLRLLEAEGLLIFRGTGRRRQINLPENTAPPTPRIAILDYDAESRNKGPNIGLVDRLAARGCTAFFADKSLVDLGMNLKRISRLVKKTNANGWIIVSAPRSVLEWFNEQEIRSLALFGASTGLPMAAVTPDHLPSILKMTRKALAMGHRRIVFIARRGRKARKLGSLWSEVLDEIEKHGVPTSNYNLPEWEDSPEGFDQFLNVLFKKTPPTMLIVEEIPHLIAVLNYCNKRGIKAPQDVSIASLAHHTHIDYCMPAITHIKWNEDLLIKRIERWADNVSMNKQDVRHTLIKTELIEESSIGPTPF